jgi:hypothetical protein
VSFDYLLIGFNLQTFKSQTSIDPAKFQTEYQHTDWSVGFFILFILLPLVRDIEMVPGILKLITRLYFSANR